MQIRASEQSYLKTESSDSSKRDVTRVVYPPLGFCHMNGLSIAPLKGQFILRSLNGGVNSAHLDLLRLASAAAAWSSCVDLLTGTPNTVL